MESWQTFYATAAQLAITAFAISFAVYQIKAPKWKDKHRRKYTAFMSFAEFWLSAVYSFLILTPLHPWRMGAVVVGAAGLVLVAIHHWIFHKKNVKDSTGALVTAPPADAVDERVKGLTWVSIVCYGVFFLAAGALALRFQEARWFAYLPASACVWLILSGIYEAAFHLKEDV